MEAELGRMWVGFVASKVVSVHLFFALGTGQARSDAACRKRSTTTATTKTSDNRKPTTTDEKQRWPMTDRSSTTHDDDA